MTSLVQPYCQSTSLAVKKNTTPTYTDTRLKGGAMKKSRIRGPMWRLTPEFKAEVNAWLKKRGTRLPWLHEQIADSLRSNGEKAVTYGAVRGVFKGKSMECRWLPHVTKITGIPLPAQIEEGPYINELIEIGRNLQVSDISDLIRLLEHGRLLVQKSRR
jgi:hypothetical protein